MKLIRCQPMQGLEEVGKPMTLKNGAVSQTHWDNETDTTYERVRQSDGRIVWYRLEEY